jgi:hypothetical protein
MPIFRDVDRCEVFPLSRFQRERVDGAVHALASNRDSRVSAALAASAVVAHHLFPILRENEDTEIASRRSL